MVNSSYKSYKIILLFNLVGNQYYCQELRSLGEYFVSITIEFIISKVICIKNVNPKRVRMINLTGFSVDQEHLQKLLEAKFTGSENTTVLFDLSVRGSLKSGKWVDILRGNEHFQFKVEHFNCASVREPIRQRLLDYSSSSNKLSGVTFCSLDFENWQQVFKCLTSLEKLDKLTKLSLPHDNLFDDSANDMAGRLWINKFLKKFKHLSRLDLSWNILRNRVPDILFGLELEYLCIKGCDLSPSDLEFIMNFKKLKHLNIAGNKINFHGINRSLKNENIEVLEMMSCCEDIESDFNLCLSFINRFQSLKVLNVTDIHFNGHQLLQLIDLKLQLFQFRMAMGEYRFEFEDVVFRLKLTENNYDFKLFHAFDIFEITAVMSPYPLSITM